MKNVGTWHKRIPENLQLILLLCATDVHKGECVRVAAPGALNFPVRSRVAIHVHCIPLIGVQVSS